MLRSALDPLIYYPQRRPAGPKSTRAHDRLRPGGTACSRSAGDALGPDLVDPVAHLQVDVVARDDGLDLAGDGRELLLRQGEVLALHGGSGADAARHQVLDARLHEPVDEDLRLLQLVRGARHGPGAGVQNAALLREGGANGEAVRRGQARDVVVVLAHRDLAGLQRLLELALVAVP